MKRLLFILSFSLLLSTAANAQLLNFGFRAGVGTATHVDDLATNTPIMGAHLGGFVSYGFTESQSLMANNFRLQTGLNLIRRGSNFREVLELAMSIREGYYHAWYAQIPLLATVRYEMPIRQPGHYMLFSLGPALNIGLLGTLYDRKVTRGLPQREWNYENNIPAFNVLNRLDASFLLGAGYEYQDLSFMLHMDYGFLAVTQTPDALDNTNKVPMGNNLAFLFTIGYQIPIR